MQGYIEDFKKAYKDAQGIADVGERLCALSELCNAIQYKIGQLELEHERVKERHERWIIPPIMAAGGVGAAVATAMLLPIAGVPAVVAGVCAVWPGIFGGAVCGKGASALIWMRGNYRRSSEIETLKHICDGGMYRDARQIIEEGDLNALAASPKYKDIFRFDAWGSLRKRFEAAAEWESKKSGREAIRNAIINKKSPPKTFGF